MKLKINTYARQSDIESDLISRRTSGCAHDSKQHEARDGPTSKAADQVVCSTVLTSIGPEGS
jgi:hypothetical protein